MCPQLTKELTSTSNANAPTSSRSRREYRVPAIPGRLEQEGRVLVWRMPVDLSQSTMAGRREPTSACCIICVRFISIIYRNRITFPSIPADGSRRELKCPGRLLNALANAIVDGNEIFIEKVKDKKVPTMSVALAWCNNEFQRLSFCDVRGFVGNTLVKFLDGACRSKSLAKFKQVFFILVTFWRAVTIVYDRTSGTIGFMDPHPHTEGSCGAILACARFTDMKDFVAWLAREILPESSYLPTECQAFRLAVVNFDGKLAPGDRPLDYPVPSVSESARTRIFPARAPEETLREDWTYYMKKARMTYFYSPRDRFTGQ